MDRYKKVKQIGKGAFGAAILVHGRNDPKAQYVIKLVDVSRLKPKERDEAKKEIKLLASFHHPNIVRYRDSFLENGHLHIVMDFADGGDLSNLLKEQGTRHLQEEQVLDYCADLPGDEACSRPQGPPSRHQVAEWCVDAHAPLPALRRPSGMHAHVSLGHVHTMDSSS